MDPKGVLPFSQDAPHHGKRHQRSQSVLDGSTPPVKDPPAAHHDQNQQQAPSQPATPLRRALWGSRAAAAPDAPEEPAEPSPYSACDPFDVAMMRSGCL